MEWGGGVSDSVDTFDSFIEGTLLHKGMSPGGVKTRRTPYVPG